MGGITHAAFCRRWVLSPMRNADCRRSFRPSWIGGALKPRRKQAEVDHVTR
jgi:hypothetical protein